MKILILDDNEIVFTAPESFMVDPHDFRLDTIVQVARPSIFWEEYPMMEWDEVWLDHDLGNPKFNGRTVTKALAELGHEQGRLTPHFVVLTMNPSAANSMVSDLAPYASVRYAPISCYRDCGVNRGLLIRNTRAVLKRNV